MAIITFNGFSFDSDLTFCPFDSRPWTGIILNDSEDTASIGYSCGTVREIRPDDEFRAVQSPQCIKDELAILKASESEIQAQLRIANETITEQQAVIDDQQQEIKKLEDQIAVLEGGNRAARFVLAFGTPKLKGQP